MILGIVDAIIAFLDGIIGELRALVIQVESIAAAATRATELQNAQLQSVVDCANTSVSVQMQSLNDKAEPLNRLIGVANAVAELADLPGIPEITDLGDQPAAAIENAEALLETLEQYRALIPV